jgi:hypothetical protein
MGDVSGGSNSLLIGLGFGLVATSLILLIWLLPIRQARNTDEQAQKRAIAENEYRKTLAQIIAGLAFIATLYATSFQLAATRSQLAITRDGQITDRYTRAVAQLSDPNVAIRLGGIYALERIAGQSESDRPAILGLLTTYVRSVRAVSDSTALPLVRQRHVNFLLAGGRPAADVEAVMGVIRRWPSHDGWAEGHEMLNLEFADLNLSYAPLRGAKLTGAWLQATNLSHADLRNADASFAIFDASVLDATRFDSTDLNSAQFCQLPFFDSQTSLKHASIETTFLSEALLRSISVRTVGIASGLGRPNFDSTKMDAIVREHGSKVWGDSLVAWGVAFQCEDNDRPRSVPLGPRAKLQIN